MQDPRKKVQEFKVHEETMKAADLESPPKEAGKERFTPPIGLARPEVKTLEKGAYQTYKLRNVPTEANSPTYELTVPYFSTGSCEEWLKFRKNFSKVCKGQNVTTGPGKFAVARRLLEGDALTAFENAATAEGVTETLDNCRRCLNEVASHVFPPTAAQMQKHFLCQLQ